MKNNILVVAILYYLLCFRWNKNIFFAFICIRCFFYFFVFVTAVFIISIPRFEMSEPMIFA